MLWLLRKQRAERVNVCDFSDDDDFGCEDLEEKAFGMKGILRVDTFRVMFWLILYIYQILQSNPLHALNWLAYPVANIGTIPPTFLPNFPWQSRMKSFHYLEIL